MNPEAFIQIASQKCTGCGLCVRVCPDNVFSISDEGSIVTIVGKKCIACGHCVSVCPEQVIAIDAIAESLHFSSFSENTSWLPHGKTDVAELVRLLRSRRSCRNYVLKPVEKDLLEDLVKIGTTAPSGTNSQEWTFSILRTRNEVVSLGQKVASFYKRLNKKAKNPLLRFFARIFLQDSLGRYYRRYYDSIERGLREWEGEGNDLLFHGATAVILVGSTSRASCPAEDAMLATQNILIAAHAMGLGTCLIGFAVEAIKRDKKLKKFLALPLDNSIYAVIAIGYPAEKYARVAGRKVITPHYP